MNDDDRMFVDNDLRISCVDAIELATDFLDDALSAKDLKNFQAHLSLCEGCQVFVNQTRTTIRVVSEVTGDHVQLRPNNFAALVAKLGARATKTQ